MKRGIGKFLSGLIGIPIAALVVAFAIANRQSVAVDFWPLPIFIEMPLALVLIVAAIGGFLIAALIHWLISAKMRWQVHQVTRRAEDAERELALLRASQTRALAPVDPQLPAPHQHAD